MVSSLFLSLMGSIEGGMINSSIPIDLVNLATEKIAASYFPQY